MSCILRVGGTNLDIDALIAQLEMKPEKIFRKGEAHLKTKPEGRIDNQSSANFLVSDADFDEFDRQVKETINFLKEKRGELSSLKTFPGVTNVVADFAVSARKEPLPFSFEFSNELIALSASLGIALELSIYPVDP